MTNLSKGRRVTFRFASGLSCAAVFLVLAGCDAGAPSQSLAAGTPPTVKQTSQNPYARCAGSTEEIKCRRAVDEANGESQEAKEGRRQRLESDRAQAFERVVAQPSQGNAVQQSVASDPVVGLTAAEARQSAWGSPESVNRTVTQYGTREQWVYSGGRFLYLSEGRVTGVQSQH